MSIPHILHFTWKTHDVPKEWKPNFIKWKHSHPNWDIRIWSDEDNEALIAKEVPWFLNVYKSLPAGINRADCARYVYMFSHGGVYCDLDTLPTKPIDVLVQFVEQHKSGIAIGQDSASQSRFEIAFIASRPSHPFWFYVLTRIRPCLVGWENILGSLSPGLSTMFLTGPYFVGKCHDEYRTFYESQFLILPVQLNPFGPEGPQNLFVVHLNNASWITNPRDIFAHKTYHKLRSLGFSANCLFGTVLIFFLVIIAFLLGFFLLGRQLYHSTPKIKRNFCHMASVFH